MHGKAQRIAAWRHSVAPYQVVAKHNHAAT